jgi:hypothetical protein
MQGFVNGVALHTSNSFSRYVLRSRATADDVLVVEVRLPAGKTIADYSRLADPSPFNRARAEPKLRASIDSQLPLFGTDRSQGAIAIYRPPTPAEGVEIVYRPPNSSDVKKIWEQESGTPEKAFAFLMDLAHIKAPGLFSVIPSLRHRPTRVTQIVFDRLYFDEGYPYLLQLIEKNPDFFKKPERMTLLKTLVRSYEKSLPPTAEKLVQLKSLMREKLGVEVTSDESIRDVVECLSKHLMSGTR